MKPAPFHYHDPSTIDEVVGLLATLEDAKVLAGGQSLMALMNLRMTAFEDLIDLGGVEALRGITSTPDALTIGAMTRQRDVERSDEARVAAPILVEALSHVGHFQTRNRGTIGGSLAHLDPTAELVGVASVLDAELHVTSANGSRTIVFRDFPQMSFVGDLEPEELLVSIDFPRWSATHGYAFEEYAPRHGDFAIVAAAAMVELDGDRMSRVALSLMGMTEIGARMTALEDAWVGEVPTVELFATVTDHLQDLTASPDIHGPSDYRKHLAGVLAERALRRACDDARSHADA